VAKIFENLTWTASARISTPLNMAARPSTPNLISFPAMVRMEPLWREFALAASFDAFKVDRIILEFEKKK
jgi:hypothetical protein